MEAAYSTETEQILHRKTQLFFVQPYAYESHARRTRLFALVLVSRRPTFSGSGAARLPSCSPILGPEHTPRQVELPYLLIILYLLIADRSFRGSFIQSHTRSHMCLLNDSYILVISIFGIVQIVPGSQYQPAISYRDLYIRM